MRKYIINTSSYYSKYCNKYLNDCKDKFVAISRTVPVWYKGNHMKDLAPSFKLLYDLKDGRISEEQYKFKYERALSNVDILEVIESLNGKTVLCFEKEGFCHRHLLIDYLKRLGKMGFNIESEELA